MSTILITGVNGFVGEHLSRELTQAGHEVIGTDRQPSMNPILDGNVTTYYPCDLTDDGKVDSLPLTAVEGVIHLAGLAAVGPSFEDPRLYMHVNTGVLIGLFEGLMRADSARPRVIAISSAALYAQNEDPINEDAPVTVESPYAASKLSSEALLKHYRQRGFSDSVIVRPFNHIGPHQGPGFLIPDIALQLKEAEPNQEIMVGNIKTSRDYTDVRDVARAYRMLLEADSLQHEIYNVCSGEAVTGEEVLRTLKQVMDRGDVTISIDEDRIRPNDNMFVQGSYQRIKQDTGWEPSISLETTLRDFVAEL